MGEARHLHWGAARLWRQLCGLLPDLSVEVLARADSTNTVLIERARRTGVRPPMRGEGDEARTARRSSDHETCLLVAEHQTHGRGRLGRHWVAAPGRSLTFSLALSLEPQDWSGLSLAVGLALADAIDPPAAGVAPRVGLKWPNDLWLLDADGSGRKLGGVLIETVAVGQSRVAVVGVGLNVMPQPSEGMDSGFACMRELDRGVTAPALLERVALPLVRAIKDFERQGFAPLAPRYGERDLLRGRAVTTSLAECPAGSAEGVGESGALIVVDEAGVRHELLGGEVSVRPAAGAQGRDAPC